MRSAPPDETPEEKKERKRGYQRKWYATHKAQADAASKKWEQEHRVLRTERNRVRRKTTREKFSGDLRRRYGITAAEYQCRLRAQGFGCAICGNESNEDGRRLVVDHDHTTGNVRGILCHLCNVGIGALGDTVERVQSAASYLTSDSRFC